MDIKRGLKRKEGKGNNEGRMVWENGLGRIFFSCPFLDFRKFRRD